jgi:hypothetical protein
MNYWLLVLFILLRHCSGVKLSHTRFLKRAWEAQTLPHASSFTIDEPVQEVWRDISKHLEYCKLQGFGDDAIILDDGKTVQFGGCNEDSSSSSSLVEKELNQILYDTKMWTKAIISDFSVCPFTINEKEAGIPKGNIRYTISAARSVEQAFCAFWEEMSVILENTNEEVSTVLLMYGDNGLFMHDIELFEMYTACLDDCLTHSRLGIQDEIQLVYFHPQFQFRDKDAQNVMIFANDGTPLGLSSEITKPIDYSRRSPYPTINILRAPQVGSTLGVSSLSLSLSLSPLPLSFSYSIVYIVY